MLDKQTIFEIEYETDRFCEDLKVLTVVTDQLFTGIWQIARKLSEPDGSRYLMGTGVVSTSR